MKLTVADIELILVGLDRLISRYHHEIKMGELGKGANNPVSVRSRLERAKQLRIKFLMLEANVEL